MKDLYTADYIEWLKANEPNSDYTKDVLIDFHTQEQEKRVLSKFRSAHTVIARGDEDSYDQWRDNEYNWSDFSREIRA